MELKEKLDELGTAFGEFKKTNDQRLKEIEEKGVATAATEEKLANTEAAMTKLEGQIEDLKAAFNRKPQGSSFDELKAEDKDNEMKYRLELNEVLRGKQKSVDPKLMEWSKKKHFENSMGYVDEEKAMTVDSDEDGGFLVSPTMATEIIKAVFESSPIRQFASVQTIGSNSFEQLWDGGEVDSGWVGETQVRTGNQGTPQLKKIIIPVDELFSNPPASQNFLDDASVNVESWLQAKVSEKFSRDEATAFMLGNGSNKPKGILAYAGTSEAFNSVQVQRTANATALAGDDLISIQSLLKEAHQMSAMWMINRLNVAAIRKLKDTNDGQYLWQPGLTAGQPNQLLGKPVHFASDLDSTLAIDKFTAVYGDFKGYQIVDRIGIRVLRDPYTNKPYVHFYTTKRTGGGVTNFEKLKILQQKAS